MVYPILDPPTINEVAILEGLLRLDQAQEQLDTQQIKDELRELYHLQAAGQLRQILLNDRHEPNAPKRKCDRCREKNLACTGAREPNYLNFGEVYCGRCRYSKVLCTYTFPFLDNTYYSEATSS